jgi:hypothetical protein
MLIDRIYEIELRQVRLAALGRISAGIVDLLKSSGLDPDDPKVLGGLDDEQSFLMDHIVQIDKSVTEIFQYYTRSASE